jgi:BlaI family transcriptional regulator, penicillinase repressor
MTQRKNLSRRERQIMDVVYRLEEASVADVQTALADPPGYSAVRALLRILVDKGQLVIRKEGNRYLYSASTPVEEARETAVKHMMDVFFDNSVERVVSTLLEIEKSKLSEDDLDRLQQMIDGAREDES